MGSALEGLAAYKARKAAEEERREAASKPKVQRVALEKDGDSFVFRFAQEVDPDATNYSEEAGLGFVNIEHKHPDPKNGYKNKGNCSEESQGACYPCEKVKDYSVEWADRKGWKQKEVFYVNIVAGEPREVEVKVGGQTRKKFYATDIDQKTGDGTVYLLEQGTYNGIWDQLVNYAVDDETILETYWKITRKGNDWNNTSYILTKGKALPKGVKEISEFELYDIKEDILTEVPYAQQEAYYWRGIEGGDAPAESSGAETGELVGAGASAGGSDDSW